jgi:hypothetical protein
MYQVANPWQQISNYLIAQLPQLIALEEEALSIESCQKLIKVSYSESHGHYLSP